jgi:hypothetical protein
LDPHKLNPHHVIVRPEHDAALPKFRVGVILARYKQHVLPTLPRLTSADASLIDGFERERDATSCEQTFAEFECLRSGQRRRIGRRDDDADRG